MPRPSVPQPRFAWQTILACTLSASGALFLVAGYFLPFIYRPAWDPAHDMDIYWPPIVLVCLGILLGPVALTASIAANLHHHRHPECRGRLWAFASLVLSLLVCTPYAMILLGSLLGF